MNQAFNKCLSCMHNETNMTLLGASPLFQRLWNVDMGCACGIIPSSAEPEPSVSFFCSHMAFRRTPCMMLATMIQTRWWMV